MLLRNNIVAGALIAVLWLAAGVGIYSASRLPIHPATPPIMVLTSPASCAQFLALQPRTRRRLTPQEFSHMVEALNVCKAGKNPAKVPYITRGERDALGYAQIMDQLKHPPRPAGQ